MANKKPRKSENISSKFYEEEKRTKTIHGSLAESITSIITVRNNTKSIKSILDKTPWFPYVSFTAIETYNDYIKESGDKERNCFVLLFSSNNKHEQNLLLLSELLEPSYTLEFQNEETNENFNIEMLIIDADKLAGDEFIQLLVTNFYFKFPMMFVYSGLINEFIDVIDVSGFRVEN